MKKLFTSESVTIGHPDKVCDQISDSVLDAILAQDKMARVACECCACPGLVLVMGEVTTTAKIDVEKIVRDRILEIGYDKSGEFNGHDCKVVVSLNTQSPDIAMGVDSSCEHREGGAELDTFGAGDQGMMFGYATDETESMMPMALVLSHKLTEKLTEVRRQGVIKGIRPDGKAQVTVEYVDDIPVRVDTVVLSTQHEDWVDMDALRAEITEKIIKEVIPTTYVDENTKIYINPTGRFVTGGPDGDSGLTGRKIIVDTYGGYCPHGGGCFSGKDPTKVDRSAAYMARYICKNVVASGLAKKIEIEVAYAIGRARPVSLCVNTFHTGKLTDEELTEVINATFDLRPASIIENLKLRQPIYEKTSRNGHFGHKEFPWERIDKVDELREQAKKFEN
ncbi:MAG: methionine adenosyltransferase [Clostridia bacterium]|nr:methionine adenosyltransferase [Clostridia bacterium]